MHDSDSTDSKAEDEQNLTLKSQTEFAKKSKIKIDELDDTRRKETSYGGRSEGEEDDEAMDVDEDQMPSKMVKEEEDADMENAEAANSNGCGGARNSAQSALETGSTNERGRNLNKTGESMKNGQNSQSAAGTIPRKSNNSQKNKNSATTTTNGSTAAASAAAPESGSNAAPNPNPAPVMKGTFFYEKNEKDGIVTRKHYIRGNWRYEGTAAPAQRFELWRLLADDEKLEKLPADGEFQGSFSLTYIHTTSKGKQKERSKIINESGVKITFEAMPDKKKQFKVAGTGTNQFGVFHIIGTTKPSDHDGDKVFDIEFRKTYDPAPPQPVDTNNSQSAGGTTRASTAKVGRPKSNGTASKVPDSQLPDPSPSFSKGVCCLRGKMYKDESQDLGLNESLHKISGVWAEGLDHILADPENSKGRLSEFEYEHKSTVTSSDSPVSGKYAGWFEWKTDDVTSTRINERDVLLKFKKNNAGYYNIEGKGSNAFGKYTISGSLTNDRVITIFRHFAPRKVRASSSSATAATAAAAAPAAAPVAPKIVTSAPPPINAPMAKRTSIAPSVSLKFKLEDVVPPKSEVDGKALEPIKPPQNATYAAVSQGTLRVNPDGSHSCAGKWAAARDHLTNESQTLAFNVRLEPHDAAAAAELAGKDPAANPFPLDSALYKGSFQLRRQGTGSRVKHDLIVDDQVVMKFCLNTQGTYNVYGKGSNAIGTFELVGTCIVLGPTSGRIELFRSYPQDLLNKVPAAPAGGKVGPSAIAAPDEVTKPSAVSKPAVLPGPPPPGTQRRESTRTVKLPSKLEEDDPQAQLTRIMEKCQQVLRFIKDKDTAGGGIFAQPVDPVALNIPNYFEVITEPMDLQTITKMMDGNEISSPEEFARLVRLIFENAMKFNIDPAHSVHRAARALISMFNRKYADVERQVQKFRKDHGIQPGDKGKKVQDVKGKKGKKPEPEPEKPKTIREQRLADAQTMAAENAKAMSVLVAAASPNTETVSRTEFSLLLGLIETMHHQMVAMHTLLAQLSPDEIVTAPPAAAPTGISIPAPAVSAAPPPPVQSIDIPVAPAPEPKKKPQKRKSEVLKEPAPPVVDDCTPLTIEEQTLLTETINELDPEHLGGVIQIIQEAAPVGADEDEIDLDIDQLDHKTQRKLFLHVQKFVKKKIPPPKKKAKTSNSQTGGRRSKTPPVPRKQPAPAPAPVSEPPPEPKAKVPEADTFFQIFGNKDDDSSDSDSEEEGEVTSYQPQNKTKPGPQGGKAFTLNNDDKDDDDDDDDDNEFGFGPAATSWNISKPADEDTKNDGDDGEDDAWGAAREAAKAGKVREAERKAREKKIEIEAEKAKDQRLADAAARGEEIKAQREEEEAKKAELREQKEKEAEEARKAAREAARAQVQAVEQTVDLDYQRDIMKQYEPSYSGEYGNAGASPSSDFGF